MPVSNAPLDEVAECGVGPLFTQVTVSPTLTVIVPGLKLKSTMLTEPLAAAIAFGLGLGASSRSSARTCGSGGGGAAAAGAGSAGAGAGAGSAGSGAACSGAACSAAVVSVVAGSSLSCAHRLPGSTSAAVSA
jgi:hypothetical protein